MNWDRDLAGGLPDCRLRGPRRRATTAVHPRHGLMERVFCANCGRDGGLVTADWSPHVFYVCEPCAAANGALSAPEIPAAIVRGES